MLLNQNQRPDNMVKEDVNGATAGRMYNSFNDRYEQSYIEALNQFTLAIRSMTISFYNINAHLNHI